MSSSLRCPCKRSKNNGNGKLVTFFCILWVGVFGGLVRPLNLSFAWGLSPSHIRWADYCQQHYHHHYRISTRCTSEITLFQSSDDYGYEEESISTTKQTGRRRRGPIRIPNPKAEQAEQNRQEAQDRHQQALQDPTLLTNVHFEERSDIHPATKRALAEVMGLQSMTEVQSKTYAVALAGRSVLGQSRTGTGKTLAFLLPVLERILANEQRLYHPGKNIGCLIVAPTRELAIQITDQAKELLFFHNGGETQTTNASPSSGSLSVLCLYGGTNIQKDIALLNQKIPTIVVCTPGRLKDHILETRLRGRPFRDVVAEIAILVLDETDILLQSFKREMNTIVAALPRPTKRQTLLFSATLPHKMKSTFENVLPEDYYHVECVDYKNIQSETNQQVQQSYLVLDTMDKYISALVALVLHLMQNDNYNASGETARTRQSHPKIMVFLPTTRLVRYFAELFEIGGIVQQESKKNNSLRVFQLHSKMSQSARNRVSNAFRGAKEGVLFTTDVSARGMDYPDISVVLQYGAPNTKEGYIHRIGRTGRAGNQGIGLIVLLPCEQRFLAGLRKRRIYKNTELEKMVLDLPSTPDALETARTLVRNSHRALLPAAETAYLSILAYYSARAEFLSLSNAQVLDLGKSFAEQAGLNKTPELSEALSKDLNLL